MADHSPYVQLAELYDPLFLALGKDYLAESQQLVEIIGQYKGSQGNDLLDIGCGTGEHIRYLRSHYRVTGVDASSEMLAMATRKNPGVRFLHQDMIDLQIDQCFDVVICLFSAIGYLVSKDGLEKAIRKAGLHLRTGGVLVVEPWYSPESISDALDLAEFGEREGIKACRMRQTTVHGRTASNTSHVSVSQNGQVRYHVSHHVFGLYSRQDYLEAYEQAGIEMCSMSHDLSGRGLYVGIKKHETDL